MWNPLKSCVNFVIVNLRLLETYLIMFPSRSELIQEWGKLEWPVSGISKGPQPSWYVWYQLARKCATLFARALPLLECQIHLIARNLV